MFSDSVLSNRYASANLLVSWGKKTTTTDIKLKRVDMLLACTTAKMEIYTDTTV